MITNELNESEPPTASDIKLSTITVTANINTFLNLQIIAKHMELTPNLIGIGIDGSDSRGAFLKNNKNQQKRKTKRQISTKRAIKIVNNNRVNKNQNKKDFYNQCTVIACPKGIDPSLEKNPELFKKLKNEKILINIKLFNNGEIVLVGCKSVDDAQKAVKDLVDNIKVSGEITYNIGSKLEIEFDRKEFIKYHKEKYPVLNMIKNYALNNHNSEYFDVNLDLEDILQTIFPEKIIPRRKTTIVRKNNPDESQIQNQIPEDSLNDSCNNKDTVFQEANEERLMILIKMYQILNLYYNDEGLLKELKDGGQIEIFDTLIKNFNNETRSITCILPSYLHEKTVIYNHSTTRIGLINSCFHVNFKINRINIQKILVEKYKITADFKPDKYQGVNSKYISRVNCQETNHQLCMCSDKKKCQCKCKCKQVSNLIFRKGSVIITGAQTWDQILDSYNFIKNVLLTEYSEIVSNQPDKPKKKTNLPPSFNKDDFVYLNKSHIKSNPKNFYLIKKLKINHI